MSFESNHWQTESSSRKRKWKKDHERYVLPTAKEQPQIATVAAVGPGTKEEKMEVKAGNMVIFQYGGTGVKFEGEEYTILSQRDILAKVEK